MSAEMKTMFGLHGRRALVTGASRGIGRAIAEGLAKAGAEIVIHYHQNAGAAAEVESQLRDAGGKAVTIGADLAARGSGEKLAQFVKQHWGALDILVNNAGDMVGRSTLEQASDELIDRILQVNLYGALHSIRSLSPLLRLGDKSSIINVSSISAHNGGAGGVSIYAAAKGAINSLTRSLARELAPAIRVNAIVPGVILTDQHHAHSTPKRLDAIAGDTPLKRLGKPEDCAGAVIFLASLSAAFITGETVEINGGLWMR